MRKLLLAAMLWLVSWGAATAETRVALVIANSRYVSETPLPNPPRDARLIADALRGAGFEVTEASDLKRADFMTALGQFRAKAARADTALVYYAGHAVEIDRANWLAPVDAKLSDPDGVRYEAVALEELKAVTAGARGLKIVILDACRDNPFRARLAQAGRATRSVARGLVRTDPNADDMLIVYAAGEGEVAADGATGANSPFATALANRMASPGVEVRRLFGLIRDDVRAATGRKQSPAIYASLGGSEYFLRTGAVTAITPAVQAQAATAASMARGDLARWGLTDQQWLSLADEGLLSRVKAADRVTEIRAAAPGDAVAATIYALMLKLGHGLPHDTVEQARWFKRAADAGDVLAMLHVGDNLRLGKGMSQDEAEAAKWIRRVADAGSPRAMNGLGAIFALGHGVPKDEQEAARWFQRSAELGNPTGMYNFGSALANGAGVVKDESRAVEWLRQAADRGNTNAMIWLGIMLENGRGVSQDKAAALGWYKKAADLGNEHAKANLTRLGS